MYCRYLTVKIEEVLPFIIMKNRKEHQYELKKEYGKDWSKVYKNKVSKKYGDLPVKMDSLRYQVFKSNGLTCVQCGLRATHFAVEAFKVDAIKDIPVVHLNLYALLNNSEVIFTKDHILPKSKGGKDTLSNLQTMCCHCNQEKGDNIS
jgi:hypothetical protein